MNATYDKVRTIYQIDQVFFLRLYITWDFYQQARKWVVKYKILEKLMDLLECNTVTDKSSKSATAILSNAALSCAHCFQDGELEFELINFRTN